MPEHTTLVISDVPGEGYPACEWDFAAWPGGLKITANCPNANITLAGKQLEALQDLLDRARV